MTNLREGASTKMELGSEKNAADEIKIAAKVFGASVVGITKYDPRWHNSMKYSREGEGGEGNGRAKPNALLEEQDQEQEQGAQAEPGDEKLWYSMLEHDEEKNHGLCNVIVVGQAMNHGLLNTVPSALSSAAVGVGYSHDSVTLLTLSQHIRNLGFQAVPSMNDTAGAIPYAIQAGLGEYGRNGLLITPKYGPRLRLGKVFTDMPLAHDAPVRFGVKEFCAQCNLCAKGCPAKAISFGCGNTEEVHNRSNIKGIRKWSTDAEKCFSYWTQINTDCSVCIRVCPYNRGTSILDVLWRYLAGVPALRGLMLKLDVTSGRGKRHKPALWWQSEHDKL